MEDALRYVTGFGIGMVFVSLLWLLTIYLQSQGVI